MKKILKIVTLFFLISGIAMFAVPYFYKDKIIAFIKEDINNTIRAKFDFKNVDAGIFSDFPNLKINLYEVTIDGVDEFKDTRLLDAKSIGLSLNLKSVLFGEQVIIKKLDIDEAFVNLQILKNQLANYDIVKTNENETSNEEANFNIKLESYTINNLTLNYNDLSMDLQTTLKNINHKGTGVLTDSIYQLKTETSVENFNLIYDKTNYIKDVHLKLQSDFDISGDFEKYTFKNSRLLFNQLPVVFEGFFVLQKDAIDVAIDYKTNQADLKEFLSLIPEEYLVDFKQVKTSGIAKLNGRIEGLIKGDDLPAFNVDLDIKNGKIAYPDLPENISKLSAKALVDFKGGSNLDALVVDIPRIQFNIADNTALGNLKITHPVSDPYIITNFKSKFDLEKVKNALKLKEIKELKGLLDTDFSLKGALSHIENQNYDKFNASGYLKLQDFLFKSDSLPTVVAVTDAALAIKPESLKIERFISQIGNSDFDVSGAITNYLLYALGKDQTLKAKIFSHSNYLDLNEFMGDDKAAEDTQEADSLQIIQIPKNLDIVIALEADKVHYKDLEIQNAKGKLNIKEQRADLSTVFMKMMGGQITMEGSYDSKEKNPKTNLKLNMDSLGIQESANSFSVFSSYTPILKQIKGKYFSTMNFGVSLDSNMNPLLNTVNVVGNFKTDKILPKEIGILTKVAEIVKLKDLENPYLDKINASFKIADGELTLKPFDFKLNELNANLKGSVNLDQHINFILILDIPREKLGGEINGVLKGISGGLSFLKLDKQLNKTVKLKFKIGGTTTNPSIKPFVLNDENQSIDDAIAEIVEDKIDDLKADAIEKAEKEAEKLIKMAEIQKNKILQEAEITAEKMREKASVTADKLIKDAGNDPLKKMAAKIAADKLKKEANKQSQKLIVTANEKGDALVEKARLNGNKLIEKAKSEPEKDSIKI
jgi:hypothetical protein